MIRVKRLDITGHMEATRYLDRVTRSINEERNEGLQGAVHEVAHLWRENFESEGSLHKKWRPLATATVEERMRQGYGGEHPILRRTGSLMSTAIEFFESSTGGARSGQKVRANLSVTNEQADMTLSGAKASHQEGRGGRPPARPFWFNNEKVRTNARKGVEEWLRKVAEE